MFSTHDNTQQIYIQDQYQKYKASIISDYFVLFYHNFKNFKPIKQSIDFR